MPPMERHRALISDMLVTVADYVICVHILQHFINYYYSSFSHKLSNFTQKGTHP